jgi:TPR repeat protein
LGRYLNGINGHRVRSAKWFQKSAEQDNVFGPFNAGVLFFQDKKFIKSNPLLKAASFQGHALAQTFLSQMYMFGVGVEKDPQAAVYWARKAAVTGELEAVNMLESEMYKPYL